MVHEKLAKEVEGVRAGGWNWVEVDTEFPYGHSFGMRRVHGEAVPMCDAEAGSYQALRAEYDALKAEHAEADELPDWLDGLLISRSLALHRLDCCAVLPPSVHSEDAPSRKKEQPRRWQWNNFRILGGEYKRIDSESVVHVLKE